MTTIIVSDFPLLIDLARNELSTTEVWPIPGGYYCWVSAEARPRASVTQ